MENSDRKALRHERRRQFFIRAAQELMKEGDETKLTAKSIAERAGYSASSLYDYFESLDKLLVMSVDEFMAEIGALTEKEIDKCDRVTDCIEAAYLIFTEYFLDNPLLFRTIFLSPGSSRARFFNDPEMMPKFREMGIERIESLLQFEKSLGIPEGSALMIEQILTPDMFGVLFMYFQGIYGFSKEEVLQLLKRNIVHILKPYRELEEKSTARKEKMGGKK
jgi:AcrR family transcriptional regulator